MLETNSMCKTMAPNTANYLMKLFTMGARVNNVQTGIQIDCRQQKAGQKELIEEMRQGARMIASGD